MSDFDSAWKEALDAYFEPFMAFFFAEAHRQIDWAQGFYMLDKELQQITPESEQGRRVADTLVRVWRTNGQDEWVLVHIEVQSQQEKAFAERMFVYNYRLFDRYNRILFHPFSPRLRRARPGGATTDGLERPVMRAFFPFRVASAASGGGRDAEREGVARRPF